MHESKINEGTIAELGYDHRDINLAQIIRWMSIFTAFVIISIFVALGFYNFATPDWNKEERSLPAYVTKPRIPPFPQVQANPKLDMEIYKAAEAAKVEELTKVKETAATRGISGIGASIRTPEKESYPGSGDYKGRTTEEVGH